MRVIVGQVEVIGALLALVKLHTSTLFSNKVAYSCCIVLVCLQTIVSHAKHLASEGLGHDGLPALPRWLRQYTCVGHISI